MYSNENVPLPVVLELRTRGHDVLTSYDAGRANQRVSDSDVLAFAHEDARVVLTNNRKDFIALHRTGVAHSGIVVFTTDVDFVGLAARIDAALLAPEATRRFLARVTKSGHAFG